MGFYELGLVILARKGLIIYGWKVFSVSPAKKIQGCLMLVSELLH